MLSSRCSYVVVSEYAPHGLDGDYPLQQQSSEFCILLKYILYYLDILSISINYFQIEMKPAECVFGSAANRLIGEVVQSRRRPLLWPTPG